MVPQLQLCNTTGSSRCQQRPVHIAQHHRHSRRDILSVGTLAAVVQLAAAGGAAARQQPLNKEVDAAESPYIQELLRRSQEKKEQRDKERLNAYYKKVFKEYFEFEGGDARAGAARGIRPETQEAITQWLKDNK